MGRSIHPFSVRLAPRPQRNSRRPISCSRCDDLILRSQSSLIGEDGLGGCRTAVHAELLEDRSQPLPRGFGPATLVHRGEVVAAKLYGAAAGWHGDYDQLSWFPTVAWFRLSNQGRTRLGDLAWTEAYEVGRRLDPDRANQIRRGAADRPATSARGRVCRALPPRDRSAATGGCRLDRCRDRQLMLTKGKLLLLPGRDDP